MGNGWNTRRPVNAASAARKRKYASAEHRSARKYYAAWIAAGHGRCWRCGGHIAPGSDWHVGHDDWFTAVIRGAEHGPCNKRAAAVKGNRIQRAQQRAAAFIRPTR